MIIYHPAIDFYHCWMRFAAILNDCGLDGAEYDRIRIIDFLLCFPAEIGTCKLPAKHSKELRKLIRQLPESYEDPDSVRQAFVEMNRIQGQVAMDMVAKGILRRDKYREGILILNAQFSGSEVLKSVTQIWDI